MSDVAVVPNTPKELATASRLNDNQIKHLRCPDCGQCDVFRVAATVEVLAERGSIKPVSSIHWEDANHCTCPSCACTGNIAAFDTRVEGWGLELARQAVIDAAKEAVSAIDEGDRKAALNILRTRLKESVDNVDYFEETVDDDGEVSTHG